MSEPRRLNRVVIKEELVELTGHYIKALILNQLIYWSERVRDFDLFLDENKRDNDNLEVEPRHGWIYKHASELSQELMIDASHQTMRRYLQALVADGYIQQRHNPKKPWDRTMQYRVDLVSVIHALNKLGYTLEGYALLDDSIVHHGKSNVQNGQWNNQNRQSTVQNEHSNIQDGQAIPETTSKNKTKNTARGGGRPPRASEPETRSFRPHADIDPLTRH